MHVELAGAGDMADCEAILRSLPDWFGIEEALVAYAADMRRMPTYIVRRGTRIAGFLTLSTHNAATAEIHVLAVDPRHHRQGVGTALVEHAAGVAAREGRRLLEVKTLGPSDPDANYAATRRFYEAMGFLPLEELHELWPGNPCLIMVKVL